MRNGRILVVDEEVDARTALAELLHDEGYQIAMAPDAAKALEMCETFAPQLILTDLKPPGLDRLAMVKQLCAGEDSPAVVVVTAFADVATAVEAMRAGAADYLTKPIEPSELMLVIAHVLETAALRRETKQLHARIDERVAPHNIVGQSPPMQRVFEIVDQVAPTRATVLITGESGTGKELIANAIHQRSPRARSPFLKLHCAALAESLLESELFGHERGAFTGAIQRKDGRLTLADHGTLFLDEIGDVPFALQVKLLRFLQDYEFERVGGTQTLHADVRVIAATNRNLADAVAKGRFREDLYYRLDVVALEMPALRDRASDIPSLAKFFLDKYAKANRKQIDEISPAALDSLIGYTWPGNVRELENAIERAVVLTAGTTLEARALPPTVRPNAGSRTLGAPPIPGSTMVDIERFAILETMRATGGSTAKAAEVLGISARTIQYRLHEYNAAPSSALVVRKGSISAKS